MMLIICASYRFASGKGSAMVIDVGEEMTSIVPIYDGFVLRKGRSSTPSVYISPADLPCQPTSHPKATRRRQSPLLGPPLQTQEIHPSHPNRPSLPRQNKGSSPTWRSRQRYSSVSHRPLFLRRIEKLTFWSATVRSASSTPRILIALLPLLTIVRKRCA